MKKATISLLFGMIALGCTAMASAAANPEAKAAYKATKEVASVDYKAAKAKCDALTGNPKDVCKEEAEAARVHTVAAAEAQYKNTPRAQAAARTSIANADYGVAKAKCGAMTGNEKDVCIKEAKAAAVAAKADAKADKKVIVARTDAREDKTEANYKVAIEKCGALSGTAKDSCVAAAKAQFSK
jgi:hypothetical protein